MLERLCVFLCDEDEGRAEGSNPAAQERHGFIIRL